MAKRDELLASIRRQLSVFEVEVRQNNDVNRQGINISAEDILGGLLNLLRDWNLQNANAMGQNFPAIDLADWDEGVVVQVSSDTSGTKIKETLAKLKDPKFEGKEINKLVMMFLKPKLKYTTVFEHEGFELEIMDFDDLSSAVEHKSVARLKEISAYLDEELGKLLGTAPRKPAHQLPGVPAPSASFVPGSRDRELAELKERLSPDSPIFLWGVGGIGKTEVAIQLARNFAPPEGAYFLTFQCAEDDRSESMRETILQADFFDYSFEGEDNLNRDREYLERMNILRSEYSGTLLVIDNFDHEWKHFDDLCGESSYRDLVRLGIQLVFTTRSNVGDAGYEIGSISDDALLKLMHRHYKNRTATDEELIELIRAVDGHTLMVDLIAKTLEDSWNTVTTKHVLKAIKEANLNIEDFPMVCNSKDGYYIQAQIYKHIKALFTISGLTQEARRVLGIATLISDEGLDDTVFYSSLSSAGRWELNNLVKRGWLRRDRGIVTMHMVIRQVCVSEAKLSEDEMCTFLDALGHEMQNSQAVDTIQRAARCIIKGTEQLSDYKKAFTYRREATSCWCQALQKKDPRGLQVSPDIWKYHFQRLVNRYNPSNQYKKLFILFFSDRKNQYRNRIGGDDNRFKLQLEYSLNALNIWKKVLPSNHPDLFGHYYVVLLQYKRMGHNKKVNQYLGNMLDLYANINKQFFIAREGQPSERLRELLLECSMQESNKKWFRRITENDYCLLSSVWNEEERDLSSRAKVNLYDIIVQCMQKNMRVSNPLQQFMEQGYLHSLVDQGLLYASMCEYALSLECLEKAYEISKEMYSEQHRFTVAIMDHLDFVKSKIVEQDTLDC